MKFAYSVLGLYMAAGISVAAASDTKPTLTQADFDQCLVTLQGKAKAEGLSAQTIDQVLGQLKLIDKVIEYDRRQPEFTQSFGGYFNKRVTDWRVEEGRKLLAENRAFLNKLTEKYGIPGQYLVSFWGMETNFGSYKGKMPILDSLATLACEGRREAFFTKELMLALKMSEKYNFSQEKMVGSWAGAMGHTQFMPSTFTAYAVDGDGDGVIDVWESTKDALASAANFLSQIGWQRDERWGREIVLPKNFDFGKYLDDKARPLAEWKKLGLTQVNGNAIPVADMKATLVVPSGHAGPAFLIYDNFEVIMKWNRSTFYAISVGHLADRIIGAGQLSVPAPEDKPMSKTTAVAIQQKLNELGHNVGKADGILGGNTAKGLRAFQRSKGLVADGYPSAETLTALGIQ